MCGIVGYAGRERCVEVLMEGLGHLEYRGYDSAGLALQRESHIEQIREVGRLENLAHAVAARNGDFSSIQTGVGHTRWATHGRPTEENAHPQLGGDGTVAVVHNGIIENFAELKEELEGRGVVFRSETDTEVMAHLIAGRVEAGESLREALAGVLRRLEGSFAVAAVSAEEPGKVVAARHQSPLVVGFGEGENFLASAVQALLGRTHRFLVVENGEIVELTESSVEVFTPEGEPVERESFEVDWDAAAVELGGYRDFMLKEIHEQPGALGATLLGRIDADGAVDLSEMDLDLSETDRVVVVACGTAYHAGLLGKHAIEKLARIPVEVEIASEYRYADPIGDERTLVVAISQSGETTDTLAAVQAAKEFGARVLAVTNTRGSLITREADAVLLTRAGPEICVASTKAFVAQVAVLDLLALELAGIRGVAGGSVAGGRTQPQAGPGEGRGDHRRAREPGRGGRRGVRGRAVLAVPGAWHLLSGGARRGIEAQGDLLPALGGLPGGRDEARSHSARRRALSRHSHPRRRSCSREDPLQRRGDRRQGRQRDRCRPRRR